MTDEKDVRSCIDCHAMIRADDYSLQSNVYGRPTNSATCRATGAIISTSKMEEWQGEERAKELASTCSHYGKYTVSGDTKVYLSLGVGAPPPAPEPQKRVGTCRACYFYIPASSVNEKVGVPMGACARFGKMIPDSKASAMAASCTESNRYTAVAGDLDPEEHRKKLMDSLMIDPGLIKFIEMDPLQKATGGNQVDNSVEPSQYPTDRDVTPAHEKAGIRAWRRLRDNDGHEVYLPIFRRDFFSEIEQQKIPATGSDEHPESYVDHANLAYTVAALWFHLDETPAIHGQAGTGKTEFFRWFAWLMQIPFERISITRDSEIDDLAGKMHFEDGETVFKPGRIPKAWVKPNIVVLDEPNVGPPEVWQYIRPLTDNSKQLVNDRNEGEIIKRHQFAFLGMAMNPAWDSRNVGAEQIGDADGSRLMHIFLDLPGEEIERNIIRDRCKLDNFDLPKHQEDILIVVAKTLREMSQNHELPISWGIRNQIKVARAMAWFPTEKAYRLGVLDYLEPETVETVENVIADAVRSHRTRGVKR